MSERWIVFDVEPAAERRSVQYPARPPRRSRLVSILIGALLAVGTLAVLWGAWMAATASLDWSTVVEESTVVREDLAQRSRLAATALTEEFAELEETAATLGDVSTALDAATIVARDLEAVARAGPPSDPEEMDLLVGAIFRLAGALDEAFPGLADTGPGGALRAAGQALTDLPDAPAPVPVTGFGPFVLHDPVPGHEVTNPFGTTRGQSVHNGIDFGAPTGTAILAAADGVVERAGWLDEAAGNGVILRHAGGWETRYFHMVSDDLPVAVGDRVTAGQVIGNVGSTGLSTGPHLHFEIVFGPVRMDPLGPTFAYTTEVTAPTDPPAVDAPASTDPGPQTSATTEPPPEVAALSDVLQRIADVQTELKDIAADASEGAQMLQARSFAQQDRAQTGAILITIGALVIGVGLVLLWATRPGWPQAR